MIINLEREPAISLYYLGGVVLKILQDKQIEEIESLYDLTMKTVNQDFHIDFFYYALDWLYLLAAVKLEKGKVLLCI